MELNREQIIKGLECLSGVFVKCKECAYFAEHRLFPECRECASKDALALIQNLTEENERLKAENAHLIKEAVFSPMERAHNTLAVRADTVRKMQSEIEARCIKGGIYPAFVKRTISQIAEEIIGETK